MNNTVFHFFRFLISIIIASSLSGCFATTGTPKTTVTTWHTKPSRSVSTEGSSSSYPKENSMKEWLEKERAKLPRRWNPLDLMFGRTVSYTDDDIKNEERTGCSSDNDSSLNFYPLQILLQNHRDVLDNIGVAYDAAKMNELLNWLNHRESHWKNTGEIIEPDGSVERAHLQNSNTVPGIRLPDFSVPARYKFSPQKDEYVIEFYDMNKKRWISIKGNGEQISELLNTPQ